MAHKTRRSIPHRLERCGYSQVRNKDAKDGYWLIDGIRQPVYAKSASSEHDRTITWICPWAKSMASQHKVTSSTGAGRRPAPWWRRDGRCD